MFQNWSLNHKIPLEELRQSPKGFEEGKVSTSSFDNLADWDTDKGEEEWSLRISSGPSAVTLLRSWSDLISFVGTGRVPVLVHSRHFSVLYYMHYLTLIPSE